MAVAVALEVRVAVGVAVAIRVAVDEGNGVSVAVRLGDNVALRVGVSVGTARLSSSLQPASRQVTLSASAREFENLMVIAVYPGCRS